MPHGLAWTELAVLGEKPLSSAPMTSLAGPGCRASPAEADPNKERTERAMARHTMHPHPLG